MADGDGADRRMILARPAADNAIVYQHHAHMVGEAGAGLEFLQNLVDVHTDSFVCGAGSVRRRSKHTRPKPVDKGRTARKNSFLRQSSSSNTLE